MAFKPYMSERRIDRTGDDRPAQSIWHFVIRMTGRSQALACGIAIIVTGLSLAPIELQRRIIDDAIAKGDLDLLTILAIIYAAALLGVQIFKLWLGVLQGWMSQSTTAYVRRHLWRLRRDDQRKDGEGRDIVSVLSGEAEALGGFSGAGLSQLTANASMLIGAVAYMVWVEPFVALVGLALILPQALLAPYMQRRLNRLVETQLKLMRRFTAAIDSGSPPSEREMQRRVKHIFRNKMCFLWWKFALKAALNLLNGLAPLGVLVVGGWMAIQGQTTVGVIVAFVGGFSRIADPIRQLISFYREASQAEVRHRMVADWMKERI